MSNPPDNLCIYCTFDTANHVLAKGAVVASSPICMEDPLLPDHLSSASFNHEELLKSAITFAVSMIFSTAVPRGDSPIVNAIKRWRDEQRFASAEEAEPVLRDLLSRLVDQRMQMVEKYRQSWRKFIENARLIRAFSDPSNLHNWQHFADNHRGVVLGFKCAEGSLLGNAKPVEYAALRPEITTVKEQLNLLYQYQKREKDSRFSDLLHSRPQYRQAEQEWLSDQTAAAQATQNLRSEVAFKGEELTSVRFGLSVAEADRNKCLAIIKKQFSHAQCYRAKLAKGKYALEFDKL